MATVSDHSSFSRNNLGDPIMGRDNLDRMAMKTACESLHRALWRAHPRIMRALGASEVKARA